MAYRLRPLLPALALVILLSGCSVDDPAGGGPSSPLAGDAVVEPDADSLLILAAAAKVYAGTYREVVTTTAPGPGGRLVTVVTSDADPVNRKMARLTQTRPPGPADSEPSRPQPSAPAPSGPPPSGTQPTVPPTTVPPTTVPQPTVTPRPPGSGEPPVEWRYLGDIYYGPPDESNWTHIVTERLRPDSPLRTAYESGELFRPGHLRGLVSAVASFDGRYSGQIDLTRAIAETRLTTQRSVLDQQLAAEGRWRSVSIEIDDQGFLVSLRYNTTIKVADELRRSEITVTYSRFGEPVTPQVPAAAVEAPDVVYQRE